jgi:hypothetical protein
MRDRLQSISRAPDWMPTRYFINGGISVSGPRSLSDSANGQEVKEEEEEERKKKQHKAILYAPGVKAKKAS